VTAPSPAIPSFTYNKLVTAEHLNALGDNVRDLFDLTMSGFRTTKVMASARVDTARSIANNTEVLVQWDVEILDTDGMFTPGGTVITCQTPGLYRVAFHAMVAPVSTSSANAMTFVKVTRNSTTPSTGAIASNAGALGSNTGSAASCNQLVRLAAGDVLRCYVRQTSGNSTSFLLTHGGTRVSAVWVAP
jgi:hypothetical protein